MRFERFTALTAAPSAWGEVEIPMRAVAAARPGRQNNIEAKGSPRRGPSVLGQPKPSRHGIPISDHFGPGWPEVPGKDQKAAHRGHALPFAVSPKNEKGASDMENKKVVQLPVEYQVGNTKYSVKPIYGEAPNKETVEDKIRRLILSESRNKLDKP